MTNQSIDVRPVTFERFMISADGTQVVFEIHDKAKGVEHIAVDWLKLGVTAQLFARAAEQAAQVRKSLGKSDMFDGVSPIDAQLVKSFQVSEVPADRVKILTLVSPVGFRCDFAIRTDITDQFGRALPAAIAEELVAPVPETQR